MGLFMEIFRDFTSLVLRIPELELYWVLPANSMYLLSFYLRFLWYFAPEIFSSYSDLQLYEDEVGTLQAFKVNFGMFVYPFC